ncbi:MAG: right-handed parallel beta-helix repeat-containing protein [Phycisphaerales bacterium]|nr:MAG: right-handed parallel beta-helix repeat-containing protein [Phycisphaerales bacterium]
MRTAALSAVLVFLLGAGVRASRISVVEHGAKGDDGSDDLGAITGAVASAGAGDTVFLPAGSYLISDSIRLKPNIKLAGAGPDATVIKYAGGQGRAMIELSGASDVEIANLALDGGGNPSAHQGIGASSCRGLLLHHLAIKGLVKTAGFGPHGIYFSRAVTDSEISDNRFENIGTASRWGAAMRISTGSARNKVLRNKISATGRGGILCDRDSTDLVIRENKVEKSGGEGLGIEIWHGCHRSVIEDNVIDHWLSVDGSNLVAVRRNVVSDKSGIYKGYGLELVNSCDCIFTGNRVDDGAHIGLSVSNKAPKERIYWARNTIRRATTWGAQIQGEEGGASYQYFFANRFIETWKSHPKALYSGQGYGFRFNGNCHYITLDGNEIRGNGCGGIQFTGAGIDQLSFVGNSITSNGGPSVNSDPGEELQWENNRVIGNGRDVQLSSRGFSNRGPAASFEQTTRGRAGLKVAFENTSSDPDGTIARVLWDFDDGIPSTQARGEHTYDRPGQYRVALIVWDNKGRAGRAERIVKIAGGGSGPSN